MNNLKLGEWNEAVEACAKVAETYKVTNGFEPYPIPKEIAEQIRKLIK